MVRSGHVIRDLDPSDERDALQILKLQTVSYAVEARLIGSWDIPPVKDTVHTLRQSGETFCGYFVEGQLAGLLSYKKEGDVLDIHRLAVHPDHFRKGIARSLIEHVERTAQPASKAIVSTGAKNTPARSLYLSMGFEEMEEVEVVPGLRIARFEKPF
jgi:ribosomal protein S18 acetylase RimI-like enzyme